MKRPIKPWVVSVASAAAFVAASCIAHADLADVTAFGIAVSDSSNLNGTIVDYAKTNSTDTIISNINNIATINFEDINGDSINEGGFPYGGEIFLGDGGAGPIILFSVTSMAVGPISSFIYGTFSGTVDSGYDVNNIFGLGSGADLAGQTIAGSFEFDPSAFAEQVSNGRSVLNALSGPVFGLPIMQPPATVTETINGRSLTSIGIGASSAFVFQNDTPEPSTWAMMLVGFAGLGFAGYRKSRRIAAAS
jgi:PEP-CTERM motif